MVRLTSVPAAGRRTPGNVGFSGLTSELANWRTPDGSNGGEANRPRGRRRRISACAGVPQAALRAASPLVDFRKVRLVNILTSLLPSTLESIRGALFCE